MASGVRRSRGALPRGCGFRGACSGLLPSDSRPRLWSPPFRISAGGSVVWTTSSLRDRCPMACSRQARTLAFRKAALDGLRFEARLGAKRDEGYGHEDVEFVRRVLARGGSAVWSPQFRVQHYVDPARMSPAYLVRFERDRARSRIRASRRPSGPNIFGVPLPVIAGYVVALHGRAGVAAVLSWTW